MTDTTNTNSRQDHVQLVAESESVLNNFVDSSKLNSVSEVCKSGSREIGKLSLLIPTPWGNAGFELADYSASSAKRTVDLSEPETVVVSAETNQLDVQMSKDGIEAAVSVMTAMTGFIGMLASKDAEMANARREHDIRMLELQHNLKMQELRLQDEINANRHERVMKEKTYKV